MWRYRARPRCTSGLVPLRVARRNRPFREGELVCWIGSFWRVIAKHPEAVEGRAAATDSSGRLVDQVGSGIGTRFVRPNST